MNYGIARVKNPKHPKRPGRRQCTWGQLRGARSAFTRLTRGHYNSKRALYAQMLASAMDERRWALSLPEGRGRQLCLKLYRARVLNIIDWKRRGWNVGPKLPR